MRLLKPIVVASAEIFGTKIGNYKSLRSGNKYLNQKLAGPSFANYYANADPAPLKVFPFYDAKLQVRLDRAERLSKRKANKAKKGSIQAPGTKGKGKVIELLLLSCFLGLSFEQSLIGGQLIGGQLVGGQLVGGLLTSKATVPIRVTIPVQTVAPTIRPTLILPPVGTTKSTKLGIFTLPSGFSLPFSLPSAFSIPTNPGFTLPFSISNPFATTAAPAQQTLPSEAGTTASIYVAPSVDTTAVGGATTDVGATTQQLQQQLPTQDSTAASAEVKPPTTTFAPLPTVASKPPTSAANCICFETNKPTCGANQFAEKFTDSKNCCSWKCEMSQEIIASSANSLFVSMIIAFSSIFIIVVF